MTGSEGSTAPADSNAPPAEPLTNLFKMSPTAGVATTDYASINSMAIVTILLGVASVLSLFSSYVLIVPLAGIICGIIAVRQIRDSNGTQVGMGLTICGMLLSLGIGGSVLGYQSVKAWQVRQQEQQIATLIDKIGSLLADKKYEEIYSLSSPRLQQRVPKEQFVAHLSNMNANPNFGQVQWIQWNGLAMAFEVNPDSGVQTATTMAKEKVEKFADPSREVMVFTSSDKGWLLEDIPRVFPSKTKGDEQDPGRPAPRQLPQ